MTSDQGLKISDDPHIISTDKRIPEASSMRRVATYLAVGRCARQLEPRNISAGFGCRSPMVNNGAMSCEDWRPSVWRDSGMSFAPLNGAP